MPGTTPPYWRLFVQYNTLRTPRVRSGSTVRMRATLSHLPSPATSSENSVVDVMGYCGMKHKLSYPPNRPFFRLIHRSAWRDCLESPRGTNVRPPEGPKSSYFDLSCLRIPVRFTAKTVLQILSRDSLWKGYSPKFAFREF